MMMIAMMITIMMMTVGWVRQTYKAPAYMFEPFYMFGSKDESFRLKLRTTMPPCHAWLMCKKAADENSQYQR